ncbi:hypothetical protein [Enhygromyxa salina]|uniref:hypothetical protein n=1 Tax=Enhygromyxa salina TaxID=215803 RepID=UPI0011BAD93C|nr:hypothetical protein [Enhygromyxa salina]
MFDVFDAERLCPVCDLVTFSPVILQIQTQLPLINRLRYYGVGDAIEIPDTSSAWAVTATTTTTSIQTTVEAPGPSASHRGSGGSS